MVKKHIVKRDHPFGEGHWYVVQELKECNCPRCYDQHWFDWPYQFYRTLEEARRYHSDAKPVEELVV